MARNNEPVSDETLAKLADKIQSQRDVVREELAEDLDGNPEDYNAEKYFEKLDERAATDGGNQSDSE